MFCACKIIQRGPGSSVSIATDCGLDGPGIESRWGRDFPPVQTGPGAHPANCTMGTRPFPGVKCGRGVTLTTHPLLAPRFWKSRAITLSPLWATTGPVTGLLYFFKITQLFSRSQWPRGLRRRSAAARLLRSWVRIPPGAWMFVCCECCVLSGRDLCDELIIRPEESYRRWCVVMCDLENLKNEEVMSRVGSQRHRRKNAVI